MFAEMPGSLHLSNSDRPDIPFHPARSLSSSSNMHYHAPDNVNALAPEPYPKEKKDHAASVYENGESEMEKKEHAHGPEVPELLRDLTPEERAAMEKKLVRKIDLRLLPMLVLMYIMNYLDRNNIASARLAGKTGMVEDLGMTSTQYNVRTMAP